MESERQQVGKACGVVVSWEVSLWRVVSGSSSIVSFLLCWFDLGWVVVGLLCFGDVGCMVEDRDCVEVRKSEVKILHDFIRFNFGCQV